MQTLRSFLCGRGQVTLGKDPGLTVPWLAALALLLAQAGMAQQFADFETGMDGFSVHSNISSGHVVNAATSGLVSSSGAHSLRVSKSPDGWSWTVRVDGHAVSNNVAFYQAVSNALNDATNSYDLVFEIIYVPGDIPGAGTTDTTWLFTVPRMQSESGASNYVNIGLGGSDIENLTSERVDTVRVPLDYFDLSPTSPYYLLYLSLNGDWGTGTASVYYDNFRVEETSTSDIIFDFETGLDGWYEPDFSCGTIGLISDFPTPGGSALGVSGSFPGKCMPGRVTKYPGDQHPMYQLVREAVRDNPANYNLEFDFIIRYNDLPVGLNSVRPHLAWNGDDGFSWSSPDLPDLQIDAADITGDMVIPMAVPLDTWFTVYNSPWDPSYVQLNAGMSVDAGVSSFTFYYDNFAIREIEVTPPPIPVLTDIGVPGNVSLSWQSHTDRYYWVERATSLNPDWTPVASNLVATPPLNTYAGYAPSGPAEFFRVESHDHPTLEVPLFSFETGVEGWEPNPEEVVATNLFATAGSNSLALVDIGNSGDWDTYYELGAEDVITNVPPVWEAISNALTDVSNQWYIAADFTWDGLSIPNDPAPTYLQMQVAFNGEDGGWNDYYYIFDLNAGNIVSLIANSNSISRTWGIPLEDTGWDAEVSTNSFLQIHWGVKGSWDAGDALTAYMDNWRLTTVEP